MAKEKRSRADRIGDDHLVAAPVPPICRDCRERLVCPFAEPGGRSCRLHAPEIADADGSRRRDGVHAA